MNSPIDMKVARGVLDTNGEFIELHVHASPDQVLEALTEIRGAGKPQFNVTCHSFIPADAGCFIVRHSGHTWSQIVDQKHYARGNRCIEEAKEISEVLGAQAVAFSLSDTAGAFGYSLYRSGELLEQMSFVEGDVEIFSSTSRDVSHEQIAARRIGIVEALFKELDLLAGYLTYGMVISAVPGSKSTEGAAALPDQAFDFDSIHYLPLGETKQPQGVNPFEVRPDRKGCLGAVFLPFMSV